MLEEFKSWLESQLNLRNILIAYYQTGDENSVNEDIIKDFLSQSLEKDIEDNDFEILKNYLKDTMNNFFNSLSPKEIEDIKKEAELEADMDGGIDTVDSNELDNEDEAGVAQIKEKNNYLDEDIETCFQNIFRLIEEVNDFNDIDFDF